MVEFSLFHWLRALLSQGIHFEFWLLAPSEVQLSHPGSTSYLEDSHLYKKVCIESANLRFIINHIFDSMCSLVVSSF